MNETGCSALAVIQFIAKLDSDLATFRRSLLTLLAPERVTHAVECRNYESGTFLSAFVEAKYTDDQAMVWWLDIRYSQERWYVEASISLNGEERILELEPEISSSFEDASQTAARTLARLLDASALKERLSVHLNSTRVAHSH